jgi:hypothetical protein
MTGLLCPGCGTLRGIHHLLHGRIGMAMGLNPLMVISIPFLMAGVIVPRIRPGTRLPSSWGWAILAGIIAYGVVRNLPLA